MKNIHSLGAECDGLLGRIGEIEKALPSKKGTSRLLTELTKQAEGLKMSSIRRKMEYGEEYSRIFIELKFSAPYENTINYIRRLEAISPFLVIEELDIAEPKEKGSGGSIPAKIMVSTILGDIPVAEQFTAEAAGEDIAVSRDIFVSTSRPATQLRKAEVRLDGITYNEGGSTAIINGDVVREGSEIGKLTVKEIRREEVTLTDGIEDHILTVER